MNMKYGELNVNMMALLDAQDEPVTTLANAAALIFNTLPDISWAGFYLYKNGMLHLGPFCGKPACTRIAPGKGVCGTAYESGETVVVKNVHDFPGHIACDAASNSEIVLPLHDDEGALIGVLDIDSASLGRFSNADAAGLAETERIIAACLRGFMA